MPKSPERTAVDADRGPAVAEEYAALPVQQGLVFHGLLEPGTGTDLLQVVARVPGPLDPAAVDRAWQRAADRHPALRTAFRWQRGQPVQVVHGAVRLPVSWQHTGSVEALVRAERVAGFDPQRAPLVRVAVLHHPDGPAAGEHVLVLTVHHAVLDGRSLPVLLQEVFAEVWAGVPVEHPRRAPYRDFAAWWSGRDQTAAEAYWTGVLRDCPLPTPLPLAEPGDGDGSGDVAVELSVGTTDALRTLAADTGGTLNTVVHAAWSLVLGTFGGESDVVFGVVRSCRRGSVPGAEDMVGMLTTTLPLRVRLRPDRAVAGWLAEVREQGLAVREHQLAPLAAVRRWCGIPSGVPLFESVVAYETSTLQTALRRLDPRWRPCRVEVRRHPSHPLTLYAYGEAGLRLQLIHHRRRLADRAARDLLRRVAGLLETLAAAGPGRPVAELSLVDGAERALLRSWSGSPGRPADATVPARFAEQAAATPDAPALLAGGGTLSYAELDARANRLAHLLVTAGVTADTPVAVALPRSAELVIALLAVLKAGGAYVPLDPANPPARNADIVADSGARLVLAAGGTSWPAGIRLLDPVRADLATRPAHPPRCPATADSLAYVTYTSGSTGRPKGVAVPHRAVVRLATRPTFARFGPQETVLQLAPVAFDASTLELWATLLGGARLAVPPAGPLGPAELSAVLREHEVSTLWLTAGLFHELVAADAGALSGVRQLLAGGDVLAPDAVRAALRARGNRPLVNGYGPTENTTFTCCQVLTDPAEVGSRVPIGRPIQQTTAYVLDDRLQPVPVGAPGELYTGGAGLARGYAGRPDLTAERFVADPYGSGGRLYRTGDRVRWRADGVLDFLGRSDGQLKIRGFRVEPAEVEHALRRHPGVRDVLVGADGEGTARRLVAYVVRPAGGAVTAAELRAHAAALLPGQLCPADYVLLDRLPLTGNGKLDRARLPAAPAAAAPVRPLATGTQRRLAALWSELLGAGGYGPDDDFFAAGGDSLSAVRLTFRVRQALAVDLPLRSLFAEPTLAGCAAAIDALRAAPPDAPAARADPAVEPDPLPDHLTALTRQWAAWRWVGLRSAGFPMRTVLELAHPGCAAAADELLAARAAAAAATRELAYRLRRATELPGEARPALARLRRGRLAAVLADPGLAAAVTRAGVPLAAAEAAAGQLDAAETAYRAAFADAEQARTAGLRRAAAEPALREAVAWQNRHALGTALDPVARGRPDTTSRHRQHQALVASYLQRYGAKNDTIGFFGPVGWARLADAGPPLAVQPGGRLLAARTAYLEDWSVGALAGRLAADGRLRPWLAPRRLPFVQLVGDCLHLPLAPPIRLDPLTREVLSRCDGVRTATEVAAAVRAATGCTADDVFAVLAELHDAGRVVWTLEPPTHELFPERGLRRALGRVGDGTLREPALAALGRLEAAHRRVADAAGDADRVAAAIGSLESTFTELTGRPPTRREGRAGAGRTLVYEDCRRDVAVTLGPRALDPLRQPLGLLLDSARWFTFAGAALFRRACADIYRDLAGRRRDPDVPLADFWLWINDLLLSAGGGRLVAPVVRGLQQRWARVLATPPGQRRLRYQAAALQEAAGPAFAVPRPGWSGAVQHSPDLMIAARSVADVAAGRFEWVVGELHPGLNTLGSALFVSQHPDPDQLFAATAADLPGPRVLVAASREELGAPIRITGVLAGPEDLRLVFARDTCGLDPRRTLTVGECLLSDVDGRLVVRSRDGRHRFGLVEVLGDLLALHLLQHFRILPAAAHSPRITVDDVVLSRESWTCPAAELGFATGTDERARFLAVRGWADGRGVPRFVFVHSTVQSKPFFVDLDSLASVDLLARAVRRAAGGRVTVTEMLPEPDRLWLADAAGDRYTAELRVVAVDRRHAGQPPLPIVPAP
ncbi:MAG: amino acid adenylation domain-containing protein [Mycobacteriales bacterium]